MNWYEVLHGECRLYFDIDKCTYDDFFDILSWLNTSFPSETWRIFHRAGRELQSFHITGSSVRASPQEVGDCVRAASPPPCVDMAVYTTNRCWKLPYSRKFGKGEPMVPWGDAAGLVLNSLDLVSVRATSPTLARLRKGVSLRPKIRKRPRPRGVDLEDPEDPEDPIVRTLSRAFGPFYAKYRGEHLRLCSVSKMCMIAKRSHRHNHTLILYDETTKQYAHSCFNSKCQKIELVWNDIATI